MDFYPINILQINFEEILNKMKVFYVKSEKKRIDELKKKSKDEKKIRKRRKTNKKYLEYIKNKFNDKIEEVKDYFNKKMIDKNFAEEKFDILKKKYNDLRKKEGEIKIPKNKFFEILETELDNFLLYNRTLISKNFKIYN